MHIWDLITVVDWEICKETKSIPLSYFLWCADIQGASFFSKPFFYMDNQCKKDKSYHTLILHLQSVCWSSWVKVLKLQRRNNLTREFLSWKLLRLKKGRTRLWVPPPFQMVGMLKVHHLLEHLQLVISLSLRWRSWRNNLFKLLNLT